MSLLRIKELEAQLARRDERIEQLEMWHSIETERANELEESVRMHKVRISELEKDAERYQWLREDHAYLPEEQSVRGGSELDELIDSEMKK